MSMSITDLKRALSQNEEVLVAKEEVVLPPKKRVPNNGEVIVRQNSLTQANKYFEKQTPSVEQVLAVAQVFESWVWREVDE